MLIDMFAALFAGAGLAGLVLGLRWLTKRHIGAWVIPASIGAGMLLFSVWAEYSWYPRVSGALPEGVVIVSAPEDRAFYRPWTYLFPVTSRFLALDGTALRRSVEAPDLRLADALVVQRWAGARRMPLAFDCAANLRAELGDGAVIGADGVLTGAAWQEVAPGDAMQAAACSGER